MDVAVALGEERPKLVRVATICGEVCDPDAVVCGGEADLLNVLRRQDLVAAVEDGEDDEDKDDAGVEEDLGEGWAAELVAEGEEHEDVVGEDEAVALAAA